ncbi:MAG: PilN domain-containing protein [Rhizobacter sp.]
MASIENDLRLFGLDLRHLGRESRAAWSALQHSWLFSWLTPRPLVRLLLANETQRLCHADHVQEVLSPKKGVARFTAVELPQEFFLIRQLKLPRALDATQVRVAVELDVKNASPFAESDLAWGYALRTGADGAYQAWAAIASRKQIQSYLLAQDAKLIPLLSKKGSAENLANDSNAVEVWACPPDSEHAVVLQGYAEKSRERYVSVRRNWALFLVLLLVAILALIAVTPTAQLRLLALDAARQHQALVEGASATVKERESLLQTSEKLKSLSTELSARIDPLRVLEMLTSVMPDDTYVHAFKLQNNRVTLMGQTANASALMQLLGNQPGLRDVRAPSAANRSPGATKDSYVIEFVLDPSAFAVATLKPDLPTPNPVAQSASEASTAAPPAPPQGAGPPSAASVVATPAHAPAPPPAADAVAGRAVFGGTTVVRRPSPVPSDAPASGGRKP